LFAQKTLNFTNETCEKIDVPYKEGDILKITCEYEFENRGGSVVSLSKNNDDFIVECTCSKISDVNVGPGQKGKIFFTYVLDPNELSRDEYQKKVQEFKNNDGLIEKEFGFKFNDEFYQLYFTASVDFR
jgi:hypothetical protein